MTEVDARTLGARIQEARKRADVSQDELGKVLNVDRTAVSRIEDGSRKVSALELSDIASRIGVRMSSFFEEPLPALVAHRSSQGLDTADSKVDALLSGLADDVEFIGSLDSAILGPTPETHIDPDRFPRPSSNADAERFAERARELVGLAPDEPATQVADKVAEIGLIVFSVDIGRDTADAGTIMLRHGGVSLVNSHMKNGRRRLALAHELGHYLLADDYTVDWRVDSHRDAADSLESRLDRFARGFLLPRETLTRLWPQQVERWEARRASIWLASEFRVDMATLATRLLELGLTDGVTAADVRDHRPNRTDFVEMGLNNPPEELEGTSVPARYTLAVIRLLRDERISRDRALELLKGTFDESDLPERRQRRSDEIWTFVS